MKKIKRLAEMRGRWAVVTGATGHLGRLITDTLAEMGASLVLVDRPGTPLAALEKKTRKYRGIKVVSLACNLEVETDRASAVCRISELGKIHLLVNNAAITGSNRLAGWSVPFRGQSLASWRCTLEVNLTAVFHLCRDLSPALARSRNGSILNISSIYGRFGPDWALYEGTEMGNPAAYAASKGGLMQLTRWLAATLAPKIRVNGIAPGGIWRGQPSRFVKKYVDRTPLGRMAVEEDFRGAVAFLSSDLSRYVTGQILFVDGGWSVL